jgi:6-pyruvoyltetrahydropterin/6-carboxytetrahydropterin synthase
MIYEISQRFHFDAAHTLKRDIESAGSARIHGHTYDAEVSVVGTRDERTGMVVDLGHLKIDIERVRQKLDHHFLDEIAGLGIPTLENLCAFVASELRVNYPNLSQVSVMRKSAGDKCILRLR